MDLFLALVVIGAATAWCLVAGLIALLAGRVIHERDAHDRPVVHRRMRITAPVAVR